MTIKINRKLVFFILVLVASNMFFYKTLKRKKEHAEANLYKKTAILEECVSAEEGLPSEEALERLKDNKEDLLNEYSKQANYVLQAPINIELLPQDEKRWPLYFRKVLFQTTAELRGYARAKQIAIPAQFGFSTDLPEKEEVVRLLTQLGLVRQLIIISIQSGVERILLVSPLIKKEKSEQNKPVKAVKEKPTDNVGQEQDLEEITRDIKQKLKGKKSEETIKLSRLSSYPFLQEYPLLLKISSDTKSIYRLLYELQKKGQFYLIRNIQIRRNPQDSRRIITDLLVSKLVEKKKPETKEKGKEKKEIAILFPE